MIRRLGVIGGVGPLAAAHFYRRLIELTHAARDEDHLRVVLVAEQVPSRIAHLQGHGPSPLPALRLAAQMLAAAQVDAIAIPSATTHAYRSEIAAATGTAVFDLLDETGAAIAHGGWLRPIFFATAATVSRALYEPFLPVPALYPSAEGQRQVNDLIARVKQGDPPDLLRRKLCRVLRAELHGVHADVAVLACTELSVISPAPEAVGIPVLDVCDVLVKAVLAEAVV